MKFKQGKQKDWEQGVANNTDAYGAAVYTYAQRWAELMEAQIAAGKMLNEIAKATSHEADEEHITGFMYGAAVSILAGVWEHGETLRQWHNLEWQINDEGERANEKGTVLNPAFMEVKGS